MDRSSVQHKIEKYTAKLQNASTSQKSEIYQRKLNYYNTLQSGGAFDNLKGNVRDAVSNIAKIKQTIENIGTDNISNLKQDVINAQGKFTELLTDSIDLGVATKKISREVGTLSQASDDLRSRIDTEVQGVKDEIKNLGVPALFEQMVDLGVNSWDFIEVAKAGGDVNEPLTNLKATVQTLMNSQGTMKDFEKADIKKEVSKYLGKVDEINNADVASEIAQFKAALTQLENL